MSFTDNKNVNINGSKIYLNTVLLPINQRYFLSYLTLKTKSVI